MGLTSEVWTRPGDANFGRLIDGPPLTEQTLHKAMTEIGSGTMKLPDTFDRFDEILDIDEATPANSVSSLVRVFNTSDLTSPVFEWLPSALVPTESKADLNVDVSGLGIKSIMDYARVEAYDWDGSDDWVPQFPDWIYGGDNILQNPGFENNTLDPEVYELWNDRSGGTFTVDAGGTPTGSLAENISPSALETALEGLAEISDCLVTGAGTESDPWVVEFVTPGFGLTLSVTDTGLVSTLSQTNVGGLIPTPWTKSQTVSQGVPHLHGTYASGGFAVSTVEVLSGTYSLVVNGLSQFAGAQQVRTVKPGGTYQVKVPMWTNDAADLFRLVIRDINEGFIASSSPFAGSVTANLSDWDETTFVIADLVIPDGVTQVIVRFAYVGTGNPNPFYLDDVEFKEGLAATTIGEIMSDLYDDAVTNHAGRVVWEDLANSPNPYLSVDFDASVDSNGDAWFETEVSVRLWMRMSYRQVLDQFVRDYDIEWRIVPDLTGGNTIENGQWLLQIYNPGGMGTDYQNAQSPAIQGSSSDVRRSIRRFLPAATNNLVEGESRITARRDSGLESALGRIEGSRLDRHLPTEASTAQAAYQDSVDEPSNASPYVYVLVSPQEAPLSAYDLGDILTIHDPPEVDDVARLIDVEVVDSPNATIYEVQFFPTTPAGS